MFASNFNDEIDQNYKTIKTKYVLPKILEMELSNTPNSGDEKGAFFPYRLGGSIGLFGSNFCKYTMIGLFRLFSL